MPRLKIIITKQKGIAELLMELKPGKIKALQYKIAIGLQNNIKNSLFYLFKKNLKKYIIYKDDIKIIAIDEGDLDYINKQNQKIEDMLNMGEHEVKTMPEYSKVIHDRKTKMYLEKIKLISKNITSKLMSMPTMDNSFRSLLNMIGINFKKEIIEDFEL